MLSAGGPLDRKDFALTERNLDGSRTVRHAGAARPQDPGRGGRAGAIQRALEASGGNRRQAANLLGISLRTLFYKMRRLPAA